MTIKSFFKRLTNDKHFPEIMCQGTILDIEGMSVFFEAYFMEKEHFVCLRPLHI